MWHVSSRSSVATLRTAIHLLLTYLLTVSSLPIFTCHRRLSTLLYQILNAISPSHTHTHSHPFNGSLSRTTRVSWYQKDKTNLDFTEARHSEWHWHQLGHMQVCTSLQTDNHASTPPLSFFTDQMPFLPPNQQRQSTEGKHQPSVECHQLVIL